MLRNLSFVLPGILILSTSSMLGMSWVE